MPGTSNTVHTSVWNGSDEPISTENWSIVDDNHINDNPHLSVSTEDIHINPIISIGTQTPNPNDFMTAAEYERAMRRFISENGPVIKQSKNKDNKVNSMKELLSFIRFVKDQLKDNVDKNTPEGLNIIEDLLSEEKMIEIVDNYCC